MGLAGRVVERTGRIPHISYKWDAETDILTGAIKSSRKKVGGLTGSVELEGSDGSFILLDVAGGAIWGTIMVMLGYLAGASWKQVAHYATQVGIALFVVVVLALLLGHLLRPGAVPTGADRWLLLWAFRD